MNTLHVLVIDDEDLIRNEIRRFLSKEGYTILEAAQPSRAFEILQTEPVDVVILNSGDPGRDTLGRYAAEHKELLPVGDCDFSEVSESGV